MIERWAMAELQELEARLSNVIEGLQREVEAAEARAEDAEVCSQCRASLNDGEGYDGLCGNCADRKALAEDAEALASLSPEQREARRH